MKILTRLCLFLFLSACQSHKPVNNESTQAFNGTLVNIPGQPVSLVKPSAVVTLTSRPKPQNVKIPRTLTRRKDKAVIVYPSRNYTSDEGLSSNTVRAINQDAFGNIWFATNTGASKYNGTSFTNYGPQLLIGSSLHAILVDRTGALWFGAYPVGVTKFDGTSFVNYSTGQGLEGNDVLCGVEDKDGTLWFGSQRGLFKFDGNKFIRYSMQQGLPDDRVKRIALDKAGDLWIATPSGASKYNGQSFTNFTTESGLPSNEINDVVVDKNGNVWFGTTNGISRYDGNSFVNHTSQQGLSSNNVNALASGNNGIIWIGTELGIDRFDGKAFFAVSDAEGLARRGVTSLYVDDADNLWFGTNGSGAVELLENGLTLFKRDQGLRGPVIQDSKGHFWIAGDGGVTQYDGTSFTKYTSKDGLVHNRVGSLYEGKDGRIWMGTKEGVSVFDGRRFLNYTRDQGLLNYGENSIIGDRKGNVWFIGPGISRFDGTSFTNLGNEQGFKAQSYLGMLEDRRGDLWFSSAQGVTRYDGKTVTTYGEAREFGSEVVWAIQEDAAGNLWFSSDGGLTRYDGTTFLRYTQSEGLSSDLVDQVAFTGKVMAIGTSHGLVILTGFKRISNTPSQNETALSPQNTLSNTDLQHYKPIFEIYNGGTGYTIGNVFVTEDGLYVDRDGKIWIRTYDDKTRLLRFDYSAVPRKKPPPIHIHEVHIDNKKIPWYDIATEQKLFELSVPKTSGRLTPANIVEQVTSLGRPLSGHERKQAIEQFGDLEFRGINEWYPVPTKLRLPYNHNSISFLFAAVELTQPEATAYRYKLEGYDKDWSQATRSTNASYSSLREGTYEFRVAAKGASGIWGEPTVYNFTVLPPWYRTWWAYAFYGVVATAILYLLYRWRTAVLRKRQKELEELYHSAERFLPKNFLQILKKKRFQDVNLGDSAKVEKQIMFSDIRGFTSLTEKLGPEKTALLLNKYMGYMAPIVREYDGVVGQFLGDGILAFFDPKPEMAIDAALVMKKTLSSFNKDLAEYGAKPVDIGIGLTLGQAVFSIIGEKERLEGHVISDSVNLSARIESLNKYYKTSLLITDSVYDKILDKNQYLIRLIDKVFVVGKDQCVRIYEVRELPEAAKLEAARNYMNLFNQAFAAYEKGAFAKAEELFNRCKEENGEDHVVEILMERCSQLKTQGAPQGWDGTFRLTEK